MYRIGPLLADEIEGGQASFEGLDAAAKVLGGYEVVEVSLELLATRDCLGDERGGRSACAWRWKMEDVLGQHGVDPVGHGIGKVPQKIASRPPLGLAVQLRGPNDGDQHVEPALCRSTLGEIDVEEADWVALDFPLGRSVPLNFWQAANPVALQAPVQRRPPPPRR